MVIKIPKDVKSLGKPVCKTLKDFLKENEGKAYTIGELKEELGLSDNEAEFLERNISKWVNGETIDCSLSKEHKHYYSPQKP